METTIRSTDRNARLCRLLRADGSEWRVTELHHDDEGLAVDAVHLGLAASAGDRALYDLPSFHWLKEEPLGRGDLLQWIGDGGEVLWSLTLPVDRARA